MRMGIALVERFETVGLPNRIVLRGVFLAAIGADDQN